MKARFRTTLSIPSTSYDISYQTPVLAMGSCFADRMGARMTGAKLPAMVNPLGIAFHPLAIFRLIETGLNKETSLDLDFSPHGNYWHSFDLHGQFVHPDRKTLEQTLHECRNRLGLFLKKVDRLILTFGTAIVYKRADTNHLVNNCHKYPSAFFRKEMLSPELILSKARKLFSTLFQLRPDLQMILTVSPVRHIKDGIQFNSVSKSILRLACHQLSEAFDQVQYFPAFEIMMDDLRDYRFYKEDMIHPNNEAEDYIWDLFVQTYMKESTQKWMNAVNNIKRDLDHRPIHHWNPSYRDFLLKLEKKLEKLPEWMNVSVEKEENRKKIREWEELFDHRQK